MSSSSLARASMPSTQAADPLRASPRSTVTSTNSSSRSMRAERRLGGGRVVHVVRHGRPDRQCGDLGVLRGIPEHPEDADRALVCALLHLEAPSRSAAFSLRREDRDRARVGHVGQHGAEEHDAIDRRPAASASITSARTSPTLRDGSVPTSSTCALRDRAAPSPTAGLPDPTGSPPATRARARRSSSMVDVRPVELVVEVVLGVQVPPPAPSSSRVAQCSRRAAGGFARVVPALEGDDEQPSVAESGVLSPRRFLLAVARRGPGGERLAGPSGHRTRPSTAEAPGAGRRSADRL